MKKRKKCNLYLSLSYYSLIFFSKKGSRWEDGIKNIYHDPCQDWLDLTSMKLTSPNFPKSYDADTICTWNLTTDKGYYISLDFDNINVSCKDR